MHALPPAPPPAPPPQTFAATAGAPAPAGAAAVVSGSDAVMDVTAAGASVASNTGFQAWRTTADAIQHVALASTDGSTHVGASPSVEMDLNDGSMPVPGEVPVSRRTRLSLAVASLLSSAPGTTHDTRHGRGTAHLGGHDPAC